jgi:hypothetical protein
MTALGLKKAGQYDEAIQSFDQAIEILLGVNARLANQLEDSALLELLTFQGRPDIARVLVLARIYAEQAAVRAEQGQENTSRFAMLRSLRLYLEAALADNVNPDLELIQKIEALRAGVPSSELPVETRLALLDYFERLLSFDDGFLEQVGASRPRLQADFSSLEGMGLN